MATRRLKAVLEAHDKTTPVLGRVTRGLSALGGVAAAVGAYQLGRQLVNGLREATKAAGIQEAAERKLAQALQTTGLSVERQLPAIKASAAAFQDLTAVGDKTILKNQALLVSMGKLTGDGLERATQAALDMGAVTGNLDTAFDLVAKASVGYTSTLSRYGIILDESIPKSEKFSAALDKINEMFGGQAAARLNTYEGSLEQLSGRFGDLQEAIGGPFRDVITAFNNEVLSPTVKNMTAGANETDNYRRIVLLTSAAVADLAATVFALGSALQATGVIQKVVAAGIAITGTQTLALNALLGTLTDQIESSDNALGGIADRLRDFADGAREAAVSGDIESVATTLINIEEAARVAGEEITTFADIVEDRIPMVSESFAALPEIMDRWQLTQTSVMAQTNDLLNTFHEQTRLEIGMAQERTKWSQWERDKKVQHTAQAASSAGGALRTLFGDTKAGAYASAIVNTAQAITNGLATPPPPLGIALAAIMAAAGAKQLSEIRKAKFGGAARGGIVPGADRGVDSVVGLLRPGEMVLPREVSNALLQASGGNQTVMLDISADLGDLAEILSIRVRNGTARLEATELTGSAVRR